MDRTAPYFNLYLLEKFFEQWKEYVGTKDGKSFVSFSESPFLRKEEGYKDDIEREANRILSYDNWKKKDVGSGKILEAVIESMRFSKSILVSNNNLIFTSSHSYTNTSLPYRRLKEMYENEDFSADQVFYDLFKGIISDHEAFNEIVRLNGKKFSVAAYLLFIKNKRKYVPLAPVRFEKNLSILGAHITLSHHCDWEVYQQLLAHVYFVRDFLAERIPEEVRLLDAHSFLWMVNGVSEGKMSPELMSMTMQHVTVDTGTKLSYQQARSHNLGTYTQESLNLQHAKNKLTGGRGEIVVSQVEKERLIKEGCKDLADRVEIVSGNVSLGYDILSFNSDGSERHIEVKTMQNRSDLSLTFFISSHELQQSLDDSQFRLCFVLENGDIPVKILYLDESLEKDKIRKILTPHIESTGMLFIPKNYMVKIALKEV